jgi:hypothetical protein
MTRPHTYSRNRNLFVGATLDGLGLIIPFGKLDGPVARLMGAWSEEKG